MKHKDVKVVYLCALCVSVFYDVKDALAFL
jgi:hypothetical protein